MTKKMTKNKKSNTGTIVAICAVFLIGVLFLSWYGDNGREQASAQDAPGAATSANTDLSGGVTGALLAKLSDVPPNSIKEFKYNGELAILVNFNGNVKAYVNKCTHKQLPLNESSLVGDRLQCPWHGATFNPTSGAYLGHPNGQNYGLPALTMINVRVDGENIYAE